MTLMALMLVVGTVLAGLPMQSNRDDLTAKETRYGGGGGGNLSYISG